MVVPAAMALAGPAFDSSLDSSLDPFLRFGGPSTAYNAERWSELEPLLTLPARRLATLDRQGVDIQAVSIAPPHYHWR